MKTKIYKGQTIDTMNKRYVRGEMEEIKKGEMYLSGQGAWDALGDIGKFYRAVEIIIIKR